MAFPEYKIALIGSLATGKTSFTHSAINSSLTGSRPRKLIIVDNESCFLTFLDPHSEAEQRTLTDSYMKIANGIIILYAINDRSSFTSVTIYHEIVSMLDTNVALVLVGNKADLIEERQVSRQEGERLAAQLRVPFFEVSAKTRQDIDNVLMQLVREIKTREANFLQANEAEGSNDKKKRKLSFFKKLRKRTSQDREQFVKRNQQTESTSPPKHVYYPTRPIPPIPRTSPSSSPPHSPTSNPMPPPQLVVSIPLSASSPAISLQTPKDNHTNHQPENATQTVTNENKRPPTPRLSRVNSAPELESPRVLTSINSTQQVKGNLSPRNEGDQKIKSNNQFILNENQNKLSAVKNPNNTDSQQGSSSSRRKEEFIEMLKRSFAFHIPRKRSTKETTSQQLIAVKNNTNVTNLNPNNNPIPDTMTHVTTGNENECKYSNDVTLVFRNNRWTLEERNDPHKLSSFFLPPTATKQTSLSSSIQSTTPSANISEHVSGLKQGEIQSEIFVTTVKNTIPNQTSVLRLPLLNIDRNFDHRYVQQTPQSQNCQQPQCLQPSQERVQVDAANLFFARRTAQSKVQIINLNRPTPISEQTSIGFLDNQLRQN
jgi:GTPase KRas protein